jgi:DNA-binding transcriptional regulator YiaG
MTPAKNKEGREMKRCENCGGEVRATRLHVYRNDDFLGFPNLVLVNAVEEEKCANCGSIEAVTIPKLGEMVAAAAVLRATMRQKLRGPEIRALRKGLGMSAKALAQELGVREESVSRWENGHEPIGPANEILLRLAVVATLGEKAPGVAADMKEVRKLKIDPFVRAAQPIVVRLAYGPVRVNRRRVKAWEPAEAA